MSKAPQLPPLPANFAQDSPFPPLYNSPNPQSQSNGPRKSHGGGAAPPLPPLPSGALEREQQLRNASGSYKAAQSMAMPMAIPHQPLVQSMNSLSLSPGQLVNPPPPPAQNWRASSPVPPPGAFPNNSFNHYQDSNSLRPSSMMDIPTRPMSAASYHQHPQPQPAANRPNSYATPSTIPHSNSYNDVQSSSSYLAPSSGLPPGARRPSAPISNRPISPQPIPPSHSQSIDSYHQPMIESNGRPALCAPLPDLSTLAALRDKAFAMNDDNKKLAWSKQVIKFVERKQESQGGLDGSNAKISDPNLVRWIDEAIGIVSIGIREVVRRLPRSRKTRIGKGG